MAVPSSEIEADVKRVKSAFSKLDADVARKLTDAQHEIERLQKENARLRNSSGTNLQEEMTRLQDEMTHLRERVTRLERGRQRSSREGGNSAVSHAEAISEAAHHRPSPPLGFSPHEMRSSEGRTNAADDIEVLRSNSDRSSSPDSDAFDSWSVSLADNASDTDGILLQQSPSPDPASLTPHFPFKVFLGTLLDNDDTSTAETVEFDDFPLEFRQAVVKHTEGWVEKGLHEWPSWDQVVKPHNECVYQKAFRLGTCYWTTDYPRFYTCMTCANQRRMCFKKHGDEVWLLPLPAEVDGDAEIGTLGSFVIQHEEGKASTKEKRHVWSEDKGKTSKEREEERQEQLTKSLAEGDLF